MTLKTLNINVGVLGHVDSGKTSLSKALSTVASTACFDKNPQSKDRGITIDLGFSSFVVDPPDHLKEFEKLQYTLVDCPGHASLIRTIIGGAQIIDLMILVVDVTKGIQTQTAECLIIGEITCHKLLVVLNKIDLIPENKRQTSIEKMSKRLKLTLEKTKFKKVEIIPVSAHPGGGGVNDEEPASMEKVIGVHGLIDALKRESYYPKRNPSGPFLFSVDHCFSIRGQGTIMTGTVLQGTVHVNDMVEINSIKEIRKVKSIQMFRQPVESASQGDRVGLCVTQFDAKLLERGTVSQPGIVPTLFGAVVDMNKISYFKGSIANKSKFHISLGHETVLAKISTFGTDENISNFEIDKEYKFVEEINDDEENKCGKYFGVLEFERPISVVPNCKILGSKLDSDIHSNTCRLAFQGSLMHSFETKNFTENDLGLIKVFKYKSKEGSVERMNNEYEIICKNMFKKETNLNLFVGMKVELSTGEMGVIESGFGQSGKFKVAIREGLKEETKSLLAKKKKGDANDAIKLKMEFKRYVFDKKKKMIQH